MVIIVDSTQTKLRITAIRYNGVILQTKHRKVVFYESKVTTGARQYQPAIHVNTATFSNTGVSNRLNPGPQAPWNMSIAVDRHKGHVSNSFIPRNRVRKPLNNDGLGMIDGAEMSMMMSALTLNFWRLIFIARVFCSEVYEYLKW